MRKMLLVGLAIFAVASGRAEAGTLIVNGDFSTGDLTGWSFAPTALAVTDSAFYLSLGYPPWFGDTGTGFFTAFGPGGTSGGAISQTFATDPGTTYSLSFEYGAAGLGFPQALQVTVGDLSTIVSAFGDTNLSTVLSTYDFTFTASAPTSTLTFTDVSNPALSADTDAILDNVVVPVPEPASLLLFAIGVLGLAGIGRHRAGAGASRS